MAQSQRPRLSAIVLVSLLFTAVSAHGGMSDSMSETMSTNMTLMGMDSMAMVFFTSSSTPLFSYAWTPTSSGAYAGTCIFLIAFASMFRGLLALRSRYDEISNLIAQRQRGQALLDRSAVDEKREGRRRPWKAAEAVRVATLDVVIAGVGYLLMVAVMTMNVGYFMSVLAGVFLGGLVCTHVVDSGIAQC